MGACSFIVNASRRFGMATRVTEVTAQQRTTGNWQLVLGSLLKLIQYKVQPDSEDRIRQSSQDSAAPAPVEGQADHASRYGEINRRMRQIEAQRHEKARSGVLHVELRPQGRCQITNYGLGNAVD